MIPGLFFRSICCLLCGVFLAVATANASDVIHVQVEVVKADRLSNTVTPGLESLVAEVSPILNFTGFTLLKKSQMRLSLDDRERIALPDVRQLEVHFLEFVQDKARVSVRILDKDQETFKTVLLLVDQGTALIGGPPHDKGVLLLRIGASF